MASVEIESKTPTGGKNCTGSTSGTKDPAYDYIAKAITGDTDYPADACDRLLHGNFQVDNIQINQDITSVVDITGSGTCTFPTFVGDLTGNATTAKALGGSFDIPHLTQPGKRIRHVIAEGPEAGIYVRGRLKDKNVIELPEYWSWLVDPESITVTLTQIGYSQDLIVDKIEWGRNIIIRSGVGANVHCYYEVWGERWLNPQDHNERLHVVYDGESPADYPGDNSRFLVGGWDYDKRDPKTGERVDT